MKIYTGTITLQYIAVADNIESAEKLIAQHAREWNNIRDDGTCSIKTIETNHIPDTINGDDIIVSKTGQLTISDARAIMEKNNG